MTKVSAKDNILVDELFETVAREVIAKKPNAS
jgi:hypothetical protein